MNILFLKSILYGTLTFTYYMITAGTYFTSELNFPLRNKVSRITEGYRISFALMKIVPPIKKQLFVSRKVSEEDTKKHFNTHSSQYSQTWFISLQINLNLLEGKSEFPFPISYFLTRHTAPLTYSTSFTFCIQQSVKLNLICSQTPHEIKLSLSQENEYKIGIGYRAARAGTEAQLRRGEGIEQVGRLRFLLGKVYVRA